MTRKQINADKLPNTRAEAKAQGFKHYFTGKPCKQGHVDARYLSGFCLSCRRESARHYYAENRERERERIRLYKAKNREVCREYNRQYYAKNREYSREYARRYHAENRGACLEYKRQYRIKNRDACREYHRRHKAENRGRYTAYEVKRHADKLQRTPVWADENVIAGLYWAARQISEQTGIKMHVDHIIPLQGDDVCGLHCATNLQLLPAEVNCGKGNRLTDTEWRKPGETALDEAEREGPSQ